MKTLTISKRKKAIEKSNMEFSSLSNVEKRKAIARDILARIKTKQLKPYHSAWIVAGSNRTTNDLQQILEQGIECNVCALGAAICGLAHFEDAVDIAQIDMFNDSDLDIRLEEIFGLSQLRTIEYAYEGGEGAINSLNVPPSDRRKLIQLKGQLKTIWTMILNDEEGKLLV